MFVLQATVRFALAWIVLVITGITICSQYVMSSLEEMGGQVDWYLRLKITSADMIGMLPLYGMIFGLGLLLAFIVAWALLKSEGKFFPNSVFLRNNRRIVFSVAGFVAVAVALCLMKVILEITAIAAARSWDGFLLLSLSGALAGYVYSLLLRASSP